MQTDGDRGGRVFAAPDVHYPRSGGVRAAAIVVADAAFSVVLAKDRDCYTGDAVPAGVSSSPGNCRRYMRCCTDVHGLGLLVVDGYVDLDPAGRPGLGTHARTASSVCQ